MSDTCLLGNLWVKLTRRNRWSYEEPRRKGLLTSNWWGDQDRSGIQRGHGCNSCFTCPFFIALFFLSALSGRWSRMQHAPVHLSVLVMTFGGLTSYLSNMFLNYLSVSFSFVRTSGGTCFCYAVPWQIVRPWWVRFLFRYIQGGEGVSG